MPTSIATIEAFLSHRRLALVGVSSNDKDLSRVVMRELVKRGYEVVPVGRHGGVVDGATVYGNVRDIPRAAEPIGGVIIMVPSADSAAVVADCVAAGIPRVWLHRGVGAGATSREATALADQHGLLLVDGECPLMFVGDGLHAAHGALRRLGDHYRAGAHAARRHGLGRPSCCSRWSRRSARSRQAHRSSPTRAAPASG